MLTPEQIEAQLNNAHELYGIGDFARAERLYREVLSSDPDSKDALHSLFAICMKTGRPDQAADWLGRLCDAFPAEPGYCIPHANALAERGDVDAAIASYERLFAAGGDSADSRYNFAMLLKRAHRYVQSLEQYERAIALGTGQLEVIYSNMGVVLSDLNRHEEAQSAFEQALAYNPRFLPAIYNLGLLHEEFGHIEESRQLFRRVLRREPTHAEALARLAHGKPLPAANDPLLTQLSDALAKADETPLAKESLLYALGKVHDDIGKYELAFDYYQRANLHSRARVGAYDREAQEALTGRLIASSTENDQIRPVPGANPVFICGMFRSGSTLLEQMLAAHPALEAGGEISFFNDRAPLPDLLDQPGNLSLGRLGEDYLEELGRLFPGHDRVINKRPENFLYIGLIRQLFPDARFLVTARRPLDNCLSVYFQQLTAHFKYANELLDIAHYYLQYRRLMSHWQQLYPDAILEVSYDALVADPEATAGAALHFLDLSWSPECLRFFEQDNRVRTASVWQVRQPLHSRSSGRWHNYADQLAAVKSCLEAGGVAP